MTIRWGIVTAGRIAHTFAADAAHAANAEITAVAARRGHSADAFARQYGIGKSYEGYEALFADPDIDAVYVATPHPLHLENSSDALRAGKAVLCEKPITVSADECEALIKVAKETDTYLMEAMWTWFLPAVRKAKEWVDAGRIGELLHVNADFGYPLEYEEHRREYDAHLGGGCLLEMGVYPVAIARYFTGRSPEQISARAHFAPNGVEDDVVALFDYGDVRATIGTSFRAKLPNRAFVIGTDGYIEIPDFWRASECRLYVLDERADDFIDDRKGSGFEFQIAAVSADLEEGKKQSEIVPLAASLGFQQDMDSIRERF